MTSQDRNRPTHATGEEYKDALSGLVEQDRARGRDPVDGTTDSGKNERGREKKNNPFHVFVLVVVLAGLVGWNVYYLTRPIEPAPVETQRRVAAIKLYHAAQSIESHRSQQGELPADLAGLNVPRGDFQYTRVDTGYTIALTVAGEVIQFRSGEDLRQLVARAGIRGGAEDASPEGAAQGAGGQDSEGDQGNEGDDGND